MHPWLQAVLEIVVPILGTFGAGWLVWLLKTKFKLQITAEQEKVLAGIFYKAVTYANEWAHRQRENPEPTPVTGADKLEKAVAFAKAELKRTKIKVPEDQVDAMLHAALGTLRGDG